MDGNNNKSEENVKNRASIDKYIEKMNKINTDKIYNNEIKESG